MSIYKITGGAERESKNNFSMHRVQTKKLQLNEEQEE